MSRCSNCGCRTNNGVCSNCQEEYYILENQSEYIEGPLSNDFIEKAKKQEKEVRRERKEKKRNKERKLSE